MHYVSASRYVHQLNMNKRCIPEEQHLLPYLKCTYALPGKFKNSAFIVHELKYFLKTRNNNHEISDQQPD